MAFMSVVMDVRMSMAGNRMRVLMRMSVPVMMPVPVVAMHAACHRGELRQKAPRSLAHKRGCKEQRQNRQADGI